MPFPLIGAAVGLGKIFGGKAIGGGIAKIAGGALGKILGGKGAATALKINKIGGSANRLFSSAKSSIKQLGTKVQNTTVPISPSEAERLIRPLKNEDLAELYVTTRNDTSNDGRMLNKAALEKLNFRGLDPVTGQKKTMAISGGINQSFVSGTQNSGGTYRPDYMQWLKDRWYIVAGAGAILFFIFKPKKRRGRRR